MKRMAMAKQNSLDDYQPDLDDGDDDFEDTPDQSGTYTLGVSPSLVSRYCEGYSFRGISGP